MEIGFSLSPKFILESTEVAEEKVLLDHFGGAKNFIRELKDYGVTSIELRAIAKDHNPDKALKAAESIWDLGLNISVHGALRDDQGHSFAMIYPSMSKILENSPSHQEKINFTIHAFAKPDGNVSELANQTVKTLKRWAKLREEENLPIQLSLEINRIKHTVDPSTTCGNLLNLISEINDPQLGICWDMGHYYYNYLFEYKQEPILPSKDFLCKVNHTHIHGVEEKRTHRPLVSDESLPLELYISSLKEAGYSGIYNVEFDMGRFLNISQVKNDVFQSLKKMGDILSKEQTQ